MADTEDQVNSHSEEEASDNDIEVGKTTGSLKRPAEGNTEYQVAAPKVQKVHAGGGVAAGGGRGRKSAFTQAFRLSQELADIVGSNEMPRHEVVKRLWAIIKERKLQDPKNKQFAICDDQLFQVFRVKRFRTFGMMKHLKDHFLEAV